MIGVLTKINVGRCRHCGGEIDLYQSDIEREPEWFHAEVDGVGRRECPGTKYAEPEPCFHDSEAVSRG